MNFTHEAQRRFSIPIRVCAPTWIPSDLTAPTMRAMSTRAASYWTSSLPLLRLTVAASTPSSARRVASR
ncbi:MAG: hypothetical protein ACOYZ8_08620 [Chloroflexota bacterium]